MDRLAIILVCILGAAACAVPYADVMKDLEGAEPCCTALAGLPFQQLDQGQEKRTELDGNSPVFLFPSGKSRFAAFELPPFTSPYRIVIESFMMGDTVERGYIFFPHLLTLDSGRRIMRSFGRDLFALRKAGMFETWSVPYKLAGTLEMREDSGSERYLVVLTTDELLQARTSITTMRVVPLILPGVVSALPAGTEEKFIRHAPVGKLRIRLEPPGP